LTRCNCTGPRHTCGGRLDGGAPDSYYGIPKENPNVIYVGQGGPKGVQGAQGTQGPAGAGAQGTQGLQGPIGPGGGAQGTTGAQGATGPQGPAGLQGLQGSIGTQGVQGTDGGGVTLQQLNNAIAGVALGSTDSLSEGITNLYFKTSRVAYTHAQNVASDTWVVNHNLSFYPNVTVKDSAGTIYEGEISYTSLGSLTLTFSSAFSGTALLS
jgi:hypothetical protein